MTRFLSPASFRHDTCNYGVVREPNGGPPRRENMGTNTTRATTRRQRGFTLIELLVVVAMIGIMASIAIVGYQKYLHGARTGDAKAVMSSIRVAQESVRAETLSYLNCGAAWYPNAGGPTGNKFHFHNPGYGAAYNACWRPLNVITDSPTRFTYATQAVAPGAAVPGPVNAALWTSWPNLPMNAVEPTYVIEAAGDNNADGVWSNLMTTSYNGEIYVEDEYE